MYFKLILCCSSGMYFDVIIDFVVLNLILKIKIKKQKFYIKNFD
jgi:hypothetical protein